jgi:hypothetical protein
MNKVLILQRFVRKHNRDRDHPKALLLTVVEPAGIFLNFLAERGLAIH